MFLNNSTCKLLYCFLYVLCFFFVSALLDVLYCCAYYVIAWWEAADSATASVFWIRTMVFSQPLTRKPLPTVSYWSILFVVCVFLYKNKTINQSIIHENLRTVHFIPIFTVYKKKCNWYGNVSRFLFFCPAALIVTLITRLTDCDFSLDAFNKKRRRLPSSNLREFVNCEFQSI